jgi:multiple sugar transport system ATP-binding protein
MARLTFEHVSKIFKDGTVAVDDLVLDVHDGEFFVLLGPSGSGKTTILRMLAGLEETTEGRILVDGEDVTELKPPKRDVAMVFQNLALYPHLNVYDNIAFGVRMRHLKKPEVDERVHRAVSILGLDDVLKKKPRSLSGGQRQRVALGRAIVREPNAFLMDEPLSDLDARLRSQMRNELARIQREVGATTLYVTHDQQEAMTLGDRVGVLREGVLQQVAPPRVLYEQPTNLFVAGFVGMPPMNLAEATLDESDDGFVAIFGGHRVRVDELTRRRRPRLEAYVRRQIVIGIRPEHLHEARESPASKDDRLRVPVARSETIGSDGFVQFVVDSPLLLEEDPRGADLEDPDEGTWPAERLNVWMARTNDRSADVGDVVELEFEPGKLHVFDPRTGENVED